MNREALERAVVGACLRDNAVMPEVWLLVAPDDFLKMRPEAEALHALWSRGHPADLVSLADELHRRGRVDDAGGYGEIAGLIDAQPTAANAPYHAALLRDRARLADLERAAAAIMAAARSPDGPAAEVLDAAIARVAAVADRLHRGRIWPLDELLPEAAARVDGRAMDPAAEAIPTGLADLDDVLSGLRPAELTVIAARPSVGKTGLAIHLALSAAESGRHVLFCSLEQSRHELAERVLARLAGVEGHRLRRPRLLTPDEWKRLAAAARPARPLPVQIDDSPEQSALHVAAAARLLRARGRLDLLVVDYLGLVAPEDRRAPRHEQVGACARRLKQLAKEVAAPVVLLAQLNREVEGRPDGRPRLSDLRDSGEVVQHADVVWLLSRVEGHDDTLDVRVAKNRNGRTGEAAVVFDRARMRFGDYGPTSWGR